MSSPESGQSMISISCSNSQGVDLVANVLKLQRYSVVFEVYNPYSIIQASEVLRDFRIFVDQRVIYAGKATVSNLVNTGIFLICEVMLEDAWIDVDVFGQRKTSSLANQLDGFFEDWSRSNAIVDPVKLVVAEAENWFVGVQKWLGRIDLGLKSSPGVDREEMEMGILSELKDGVNERLFELLIDFKGAVEDVEEDAQAMHKSYVRRQLHPHLLCSPFLYRTFKKPLGYAGDYEMVNMILRNDFDGASIFAKLFNHMLLQAPPAEAHRNRIKYFVTIIAEAAERKARSGERLRVMNLGCGPAEEVLRVLKSEEVSDVIDFVLLDFNDETIKYTKARLEEARARYGRSANIIFEKKSVHQVLKMASRGDFQKAEYDLVYCAGLFDYFSQKVCKKMVELFSTLVTPGGEVLVTNVADTNPVSDWMEYVMAWDLIYRSREEMEDLIPERCANFSRQIDVDATGVNYFLKLTRGPA
ncbi:class I SAM-dependent methyltransferase [bacterium]|nr:class I SAM-dependent methyltransferase [bacterium]MDB2429451.1 class I SAM-dependent methyltransferase [Akkermansiaceae bacterium]